MNGPSAIAIDPVGNILFSEGNRVRKVTGGILTTFAGTGVNGYAGDGGLARSADFNSPGGLAFDAAGNLYIADSGNNRVPA